jgi:hypothetical protein
MSTDINDLNGLLDEPVTRKEWDGLLAMYRERAAFIDQRMTAMERQVGGLVSRLEDRLAANGYFDDGPKTSHPLTEQLAEVEHRLSGDVFTAALSRRLRRLWTVGVLVAVLSLAGSALALGEDIHVNTTMQQNAARRDHELSAVMEQLQDNDSARTAQIAKVIQIIEAQDAKIAVRHGETHAQIAKIEAMLNQLGGK